MIVARKMLAFAGLATIVIAFANPVRAGTLTTLYSFSGGADGSAPSQLTYRSGVLYGTTYSGGEGCGGEGCGTVFAVDAATGTKTTLHMFHGHSGGDGSGAFPAGGLVYLNGSLFGTTLAGGSDALCDGGCGTVFDVNAVTGAGTIIYDFLGGQGGAVPNAALTLNGSGLLGTTQAGGGANEGILFGLSAQNFTESGLYAFPGEPGPALANGGMIVENKTLYGTTALGGDAYFGTVFKFNTASGKEKTLHSFQGPSRDGALPLGGIVYRRGFLYGATTIGGHAGFGIIFRLKATTGAERVLHDFDNGTDGGTPTGGVIEHDGKLYGTTEFGGASGYGVIYQIDRLAGTETVLYSFKDGGDGAAPASIIYNEGVFYGTTSAIKGSYGTVFKFTP